MEEENAECFLGSCIRVVRPYQRGLKNKKPSKISRCPIPNNGYTRVWHVLHGLQDLKIYDVMDFLLRSKRGTFTDGISITDCGICNTIWHLE
ncbi:hypothetical protein VCO01S_37480 [Vibrio comitans NBRC 102076]|uniref:Uncharacterized protein n=1 Tax=Vibrio comitans NBRC 102076 TaxID=1219078 RepID=A0A4Y3IU14_9VIBR|nr:hypothetical protein VCO01S_37480 [Vibrio comitans NBRC 102076]